METDEKEKNLDTLIDVHSKALDDLVNVNSLFTIAVFIGLSFASPNQRSLENKPGCDPDPKLTKELVMYEVVSFVCFLVSSLAAKSLKVLINFYKVWENIEPIRALRHKWDKPSKCIFVSSPWRHGLLIISAAASAVGIIFLTLSLTNVVQIRLGKLSCGSVYALKSVTVLGVMVFLSLVLLYLPPIIVAVVINPKNPDDDGESTGRPKIQK